MEQLKFSGHETFSCRASWPKKGYDFLLDNRSFNDPDATAILGVGKNMVSSINYWLRAMALSIENEELTQFSHDLLSDDGYDPYLEDVGSIWLLHARLAAFLELDWLSVAVNFTIGLPR